MYHLQSKQAPQCRSAVELNKQWTPHFVRTTERRRHMPCTSIHARTAYLVSTLPPLFNHQKPKSNMSQNPYNRLQEEEEEEAEGERRYVIVQ